MSWFAILALAVGAYAFKAVGFLALGQVPMRPALQRLIGLLPAALLAGLVVIQTVGNDGAALAWTRAAGVAAGAVAAWRDAPLLAVLLVSAAVTALLRLLV